MTNATWPVAVSGNEDYTIRMYTDIGSGTSVYVILTVSSGALDFASSFSGAKMVLDP
uniref:Uncharacterized protein n=1 Tax=Arundo donax TaxID=35708 RepID=A0A0A9AI32_ARUDO